MPPEPDEIIMYVQGMPVTVRDLACYMAIAGSMPCGVFDAITSKISNDEELDAYIGAYDKARLAYNEVLGRLND